MTTTMPPAFSRAGDGARVAPSPVRRAGRKRTDWGKYLEIVLLAGPAILMFLAFVILPVLMAAYYGFFKWKGFGPPKNFVGAGNYLIILKDAAFHDALLHNGFIVVMSLIIQGPVAVGLALLLNQKMFGRSVIRVLIFVPYVVSEVIVGTGWSLMLQTNGAVNGILTKLGLPNADWLSDPRVALWSLMVIISWKYIGFVVILFLAGLQSIPEELFEAAAVDATYWPQMM
ncbi:MAG: sugar ABC transporter permease [Propionibacteriaceae bacterium]|nr:MAG: sugar ABC transporter permease [Propionibacteriaceae bacterium]